MFRILKSYNSAVDKHVVRNMYFMSFYIKYVSALFYSLNLLTIAVSNNTVLFCGNSAPSICSTLELSFGFGMYRPNRLPVLLEIGSDALAFDKFSFISATTDWISSSRGRYSFTRLLQFFDIN